jgi:hypothetical protein
VLGQGPTYSSVEAKQQAVTTKVSFSIPTASIQAITPFWQDRGKEKVTKQYLVQGGSQEETKLTETTIVEEIDL